VGMRRSQGAISPKRPESRAKGDAYRSETGNRHTKAQRLRFKLDDAGAG